MPIPGPAPHARWAAVAIAALLVFGVPQPPVAATALGQAAADDVLITRARDVVARLASGDVEPILADFTPQMTAALDATKLRAVFTGLAAQAGPFKSAGTPRTSTANAFRVVVIPCAFERANVDVQVVFDAEARIAGLRVTPAAATAPYTPPAYVTPSAFREVPLTVDAGGWALPGTLTLPASGGPFPAVVLVHGSGPHDRDESIGPNRPFRDIAEGLASRGIAVLRYDKRTAVHGARLSTISNFTVKDETVDDAVAAVRLLQGRAEIRKDRVFVIGHSLGAMVAPRIAAAEPSLAGLILLAAPSRPLQDSIVEQTRYLANVDGTVTADDQRSIDAAVALAASVRRLTPSDPPLTSLLFSAPASYWIDLRDYRPSQAAAGLKLPMLLLQGERDYQVTMNDFAAWREALRGRTEVEFKSYAPLNHLFVSGTGASTPQEYQQTGHVDGQVISDMVAWIDARK